jgi:hypothetical protein
MARYNVKVDGWLATVEVKPSNSTGNPASGRLTDANDGLLVAETPTIVYGGYCHAEIVALIIMQMMDEIAGDGAPEMEWSDAEYCVAVSTDLTCTCDDDEEDN